MSEQQTQEAATDGQQLAGMLSVAKESERASDDNESVGSDAPTQETAPRKPSSSYQGRVDLSGLPDDIREPIEGRFAHMSQLMRKNETKYSTELNQWRELAAEQSKAIEELRGGMGAVVDHIQGKSFADREAQIRRDLRDAHASGDTEAFVRANEELADLKIKKAEADRKKAERPEKPLAKEERASHPKSGDEIASDAFSSGDITEEDLHAINMWVGERDESGQTLRSWAFTRNPDNPTADPVYRRALYEMAAVFDEGSSFANRSIGEKLAEIDRRMGVSRQATQSVMGGSLTSPRKTAKLTLSPEAEKLAVRTKFGGPKAKTNADHIEAYRKQLEKVRAEKGARK